MNYNNDLLKVRTGTGCEPLSISSDQIKADTPPDFEKLALDVAVSKALTPRPYVTVDMNTGVHEVHYYYYVEDKPVSVAL